MRRSTRPLLLLAVPVLVLPLAMSSQAATAPGASYTPYAVGFSSGEPSIGFDPKADAAIYQSDTTTVRMSWDAKGRLTTKDVTAPTSQTSLDPIAFVDQKTHRTFVSQLVGVCSLSSWSDDAGTSWHTSEGCGPDVLLDHQSVGAGPYRTEVRPVTAGLAGYPDAVYYCAQNSYSGTCARSDDGGTTYLPGTPAYNTPANAPGDPYGGACSAIHGHLRVAPDGVVYLPNKGCGGTPTAGNLTNSEFFGGAPAVSVSEDNGQTWTVHTVPGGHNQDESDPSVATDRASTVFFGWEDGTNPSETTYGTTSAAKIAVSRDHGRTWSTPVDVSSRLGVRNVQFPEVIAGDPGRAAFAFLGTRGVGDDQHNGFVGEWHLYVATTTDGGRTWSTVDTTPHDPVQRGCISLQGTSNKTVADTNICDQRNLLDFNDITVDSQGRVLVAYADGCTGACVTDRSSGSKGAVDMVMRQSSGPLLYVHRGAPAPARAGSPRALPRTRGGSTTAPL
ncbi:MAG: sialidase family protein, partial [Mycobacteriales bacterium]